MQVIQVHREQYTAKYDNPSCFFQRRHQGGVLAMNQQQCTFQLHTFAECSIFVRYYTLGGPIQWHEFHICNRV